MTIEHSMNLVDLVEVYGVDGVIRELRSIVEEEKGEAALLELGGEYSGLASIGVDESVYDTHEVDV